MTKARLSITQDRTDLGLFLDHSSMMIGAIGLLKGAKLSPHRLQFPLLSVMCMPLFMKIWVQFQWLRLGRNYSILCPPVALEPRGIYGLDSLWEHHSTRIWTWAQDSDWAQDSELGHTTSKVYRRPPSVLVTIWPTERMPSVRVRQGHGQSGGPSHTLTSLSSEPKTKVKTPFCTATDTL